MSCLSLNLFPEGLPVSHINSFWGKYIEGAAEDGMVGWHHRLHGHEFEQTPGDSGGQGSLVCCSPWGSERVGHDLATEQQHPYPQGCILSLVPEKQLKCYLCGGGFSVSVGVDESNTVLSC